MHHYIIIQSGYGNQFHSPVNTVTYFPGIEIKFRIWYKGGLVLKCATTEKGPIGKAWQQCETNRVGVRFIGARTLYVHIGSLIGDRIRKDSWDDRGELFPK